MDPDRWTIAPSTPYPGGNLQDLDRQYAESTNQRLSNDFLPDGEPGQFPDSLVNDARSLSCDHAPWHRPRLEYLCNEPRTPHRSGFDGEDSGGTNSISQGSGNEVPAPINIPAPWPPLYPTPGSFPNPQDQAWAVGPEGFHEWQNGNFQGQEQPFQDQTPFHSSIARPEALVGPESRVNVQPFPKSVTYLPDLETLESPFGGVPNSPNPRTNSWFSADVDECQLASPGTPLVNLRSENGSFQVDKARSTPNFIPYGRPETESLEPWEKSSVMVIPHTAQENALPGEHQWPLNRNDPLLDFVVDPRLVDRNRRQKLSTRYRPLSWSCVLETTRETHMSGSSRE